MRDDEGERGKGKGTKKSGSERKKMKMRIGIRIMVAAMTIIMLVVMMALAMALAPVANLGIATLFLIHDAKSYPALPLLVVAALSYTVTSCPSAASVPFTDSVNVNV